MSNQRGTSGGRAFTESGDIFSWADAMAFMQEYNLTYQTFMNGAGILSIRLNDLAANTDHFFTLDIPEGRELILFSRVLNLTQGRYNIDAVVPNSPLNLDGAPEGVSAPLDKTKPDTIQTRLRVLSQNDIPATVREFGFVDTGAAQTGQARAQGSTGVEGVNKRLINQSPLRVRKTDANPFTANLVFVCWERDR
ncbi:hypothetical protein N22_015 [Idiomarinaceae phage 1N2-2]|uniref:hypothetical protein n=1 Tax=Idiomarinaceae phage 1N2-2 TaxID=1536592 RepID=UPI0004F81BA4|nr:hypothetical protein N22_015 [Idiomarinaceae phage 1N2-2]AIM40717.1 hypothetical protein N22_015 [Idiomarinaceae phage 1N2-2]